MHDPNAPARPDWVPRRWALHKDIVTRWLVQRPHRLLAWWLFLVLLSLVGIVLALTVLPLYYLAVFVVPAWLQLLADLRYIPRAFRAWRAGEPDGSGPAPRDASPGNASHRGASR
jgi:hypothetical protein